MWDLSGFHVIEFIVKHGDGLGSKSSNSPLFKCNQELDMYWKVFSSLILFDT